MASYLDKFKVTTALDASTTMDLSCQHITTSDWMQASPTYIKEMVPGEKIDINVETFTRLAPMPVPTFGRGLIHNRAFFVPMRSVFSSWNDFITQAAVIPPTVGDETPSAAQTITTVPTIDNRTLVNLFKGSTGTTFENNGFARLIDDSQSSAITTADFVISYYTGSTGVFQRDYAYKLTNRGRRLMKLLHSLGYAINWCVYTDVTLSNNSNSYYSALPIYAWLKVMIDWYYPSQYVGDAQYAYVESLLKNVVSAGGDVHNLTYEDLVEIFFSNSVFNGLCNYDSDYFVSAFDNAVGASQGTASPNDVTILQDISTNRAPKNAVFSQNGGSVVGTAVPTNGTPALGQHYTTTTIANEVLPITQYGLDALKALTDYVKRHQLVGARALDRFYARFGKSLSSEKMNRSSYIGAQNIPLQFGDVMSHADSDGAQLGSYAGKGLGYGSDGHFSFSTDEYGFVIIVSSIIPQIGYYQGVDRNVMHVNRLDYWTPEFDQLGTQAIAKKELLLPMNTAAESDVDGQRQSNYANTGVNGIFGYTPRYAEYKTGRDRLTGDYRLASKAIGDTSDSWHLMRNVVDDFQTMSDVAHSRYFVSGLDGAQYSRIFYDTDSAYGSGIDGADKFYLIHNFNVTSTAPMHSLYDSYEFKNEDESKKVVGDVNGVKVN